MTGCEREPPARNDALEARDRLEENYVVPREAWSSAGPAIKKICPEGGGLHPISARQEAPPKLAKTIAKRHKSVVGLAYYGSGGARHVFCSGVLVGRSHVLTAAHCIDRNSGSDHVVFGLDDTTPQPTAVKLIEHPEVYRDAKLDFSVIRLAAPVSVAKPLGRASFSAPTGEIVVLHHPAGDPKRFSVGERRHPDDPILIHHRADTKKASSGGAIFDERGRLVGLHTDGDCSSSTHNYGIRADVLAQKLPSVAFE